MENRKELSEKSKKLIAMQFKSDILNTSTRYYKKEKIFPITPKPNELRLKMEEFTPKYKEIKPSEMHFNNLMSDIQKHDSLIMKQLKITPIKKNPQLEAYRQRAKIIREHCYDERGNFSAKKMRLLDFYGIESINNRAYNQSNSKSIRETRKQNRSFFIHKIPKNLDFYSDNNEDHNLYDLNSDKYSNTNYNDDNNGEIYLNYNDDNYNKISRNRNTNNLVYCSSGISNKELNSVNNNYKNSEKMDYPRIKTDINFITDVNVNKSTNNNLNVIKYPRDKSNKEKINQKKNSHPKELNKVLYKQANKPGKSNKKNKSERVNEEKEYYNIEIKNLEPLKIRDHLNDEKKIKEIFHKNGLDIYDFNHNDMNFLSKEKKMEAKLNKNKKDENFDKNYRKTIRELSKINIVIHKKEILNKKGLGNKVVHKKRRGTPGAVLFKNKELKDENTKLNTGFGFKRDKNIQPQDNNNYKNNYNYKMTYFNHNKK